MQVQNRYTDLSATRRVEDEAYRVSRSSRISAALSEWVERRFVIRHKATPKKLSSEHLPGLAIQERKPKLVGALTQAAEDAGALLGIVRVSAWVAADVAPDADIRFRRSGATLYVFALPRSAVSART